MTTLTIGFILIAVLVLLVLLGMQIAYALFGVAFVGIWVIRNNVDLAFRMLELTAYSGIADYLFATIPLFVLMGLLVSDVQCGPAIRLRWPRNPVAPHDLRAGSGDCRSQHDLCGCDRRVHRVGSSVHPRGGAGNDAPRLSRRPFRLGQWPGRPFWGC